MMIGYCAGVDQVSNVLSNGFDYLETTVKEIETKSADRSNQILALNNLIPRDICLYKSDDLNRATDSTSEAFNAAHRLGIKTITLGSGRSRSTISEKPSTQEIEMWSTYLNTVDQLAFKYSIEVGLEPLTKDETNYLNYIDDAALSIREAGCNNIGLTLDSYHFFANSDSYSSIEKYAHLIKHVHIAEGQLRLSPKRLNFALKQFLHAVTSNSDCREIAVETHWDLPCTPHASLVEELREYGF